MRYKGYWAEVHYTDEDGCFWAHLEGLPYYHAFFEGNTIEELRKDFEEAIDDYLEDCEKQNIKHIYRQKWRIRFVREHKWHN